MDWGVLFFIAIALGIGAFVSAPKGAKGISGITNFLIPLVIIGVIALISFTCVAGFELADRW